MTCLKHWSASPIFPAKNRTNQQTNNTYFTTWLHIVPMDQGICVYIHAFMNNVFDVEYVAFMLYVWYWGNKWSAWSISVTRIEKENVTIKLYFFSTIERLKRWFARYRLRAILGYLHCQCHGVLVVLHKPYKVNLCCLCCHFLFPPLTVISDITVLCSPGNKHQEKPFLEQISSPAQ